MLLGLVSSGAMLDERIGFLLRKGKRIFMFEGGYAVASAGQPRSHSGHKLWLRRVHDRKYGQWRVACSGSGRSLC
jgi:hypothetical protein